MHKTILLSSIAAIFVLASGDAEARRHPRHQPTYQVQGGDQPGYRVVHRRWKKKSRRHIPSGKQYGYASYYSCCRTASGEPVGKLTAAHRTLPFGTRVIVKHLRTGRTVEVRINDRGPFVPGRVIDLSRGAARVLGITRAGIGRVSIEVAPRKPARPHMPPKPVPAAMVAPNAPATTATPPETKPKIAVAVPTAPEPKPEPTITGYVRALPGVSIAMVPKPLQDWMHRVAASCAGFRVVSSFRAGARVAGSRRISLHALAKAVDFVVGDYSCARRVLANFPGGLSTDPHRVNHLHASWWPKSREWGSRFEHRGGYRYARRGWRTASY